MAYIQKALENLAPTVTRPGNDGSVAVLGSADDSIATTNNAGAAYHFAVPNAAATTSLSGVVRFYNGATAINQLFTDLGNGTANPAIIVIVGEGAVNDLDDQGEIGEGAALTANAVAIADYVNSGGGLIAHGFDGGGSADTSYGWLTALIPGASMVPGASVETGCDKITLSLTLLGQLAFPGLTNADIRPDGTAQCHNHFLNHGLPVLARDAEGLTHIPGPASGVTVAETESNDTSGTADSITIGDDYTGDIITGGIGDVFTGTDIVSFIGAIGQTIVATTVLGGILPDDDSLLRLLDVDGVTQLAFNDDIDFPANRGSQIVFTLPSTGTYFLQVLTCVGTGCDFSYTLELRESVGSTGGREVIIGGSNVGLPGQIAMTPEFDFNPPGTDHMVTANVVDLAGSPLQGESVTFDVLSGPNAGTTGTDTTDGNGDASFTYTGNGDVGLDIIQASIVDITGNTVVNTARKYWDLDCQPNSIPDTCDLNCAAFNNTCAADFPGCGRSVDTNDSDLVPDECINNVPPVSLDSFQCLEARKVYTPRRYKYKKFGGITHLKLRSRGLEPENFCSPVDVRPVGEEGQEVSNSDSNLTCYEKKHWKYSKHFRWWKHKKYKGYKRHRHWSDKQELNINNMFGDQTLRVSTKPNSLCLPSGKGEDSVVPVDLDRFKCFEEKKVRGPRLENRKVTVNDGTESTDGKIVKPVAFCIPVDGENKEIEDVTGHLTCYKFRMKRSHESKYNKYSRWGHWKHRFSSEKITVNNDFGEGQKLKVSELETICVPSTILMVQSPSPRTRDDKDDDDDDHKKKIKHKKKREKDDDDDD